MVLLFLRLREWDLSEEDPLEVSSDREELFRGRMLFRKKERERVSSTREKKKRKKERERVWSGYGPIWAFVGPIRNEFWNVA